MVILLFFTNRISQLPPPTHGRIFNNRISHYTDYDNIYIKIRTRLNPNRYEIDGLVLHFRDRNMSLGLTKKTGHTAVLINDFSNSRTRHWNINKDDPYFLEFTSGRYFVIRINKNVFRRAELDYNNMELFQIRMYIMGRTFYDFNTEIPEYFRGRIVSRVYEIYR